MHVYRAALVGVGRMGAFIDNEVAGRGPSLPYSHSAGYEACERTNLIAGADMRADVLEKFGERYGVPLERQYTDFREMILTEQPDILSIATQPHQRAEVALFAIENGVKALYVEKPLCASMAEAHALLDACKKHGTVLNMGTNRRWHPGFQDMRTAIASGEYGRLVSLAIFHRGTLFNTQSHWIDTLRVLNGDAEAIWAQAYMSDGPASIDGDAVINDPYTEGMIAFENDVIAHMIARPGPHVFKAWLEGAEMVTKGDGAFEIRKTDGEVIEIPYEPVSSTVGLIEDIVQALDNGGPTRGGIDAAYKNAEILFALLESEKRAGARVAIPLVDSTLAFQPTNLGPRQPKYEPVVKA
jgi:predicted dehydrogenase